MTSARSQPFCRKNNINFGCFNGTRINPRNNTQRNTALKIPNNHFCLNWKSRNFTFNQGIEDELEPNFKVVDNDISDKHDESFIKFEYRPKKVQSQLTNLIVYDIENFNTDRVVPYAVCLYRLSKISGKYNRDITEQGYENCKKDCIVFKGLDNINEMLDQILQFEGEPKKITDKIVKNN